MVAPIIIGISGCASSGKKIINLLLSEILRDNKVVVLHENNYFVSKLACPTPDYDCWDAVDVVKLVDHLKEFLATGQISESEDSERAKQAKKDIEAESKKTVEKYQQLIINMRAKLQERTNPAACYPENDDAGALGISPYSRGEKGKSKEIERPIICLLDGFLLYTQPAVTTSRRLMASAGLPNPATWAPRTSSLAGPSGDHAAGTTMASQTSPVVSPVGDNAADATMASQTSPVVSPAGDNAADTTMTSQTSSLASPPAGSAANTNTAPPMTLVQIRSRQINSRPQTRKFKRATANLLLIHPELLPLVEAGLTVPPKHFTHRKSKAELMELIDIKLFLPITKGLAKERRFARKSYIDFPKGDRRPGEHWRNEDYFEKVAWENYAREHGWLFERDDVEKVPRSFDDARRGGGVIVMPKTDATIEHTIAWAVNVIVSELKKRGIALEPDEGRYLRPHVNPKDRPKGWVVDDAEEAEIIVTTGVKGAIHHVNYAVKKNLKLGKLKAGKGPIKPRKMTMEEYCKEEKANKAAAAKCVEIVKPFGAKRLNIIMVAQELIRWWK